jgi:hypothetical protein
MSQPNLRRRRNRTFRLEVLECRALLSTAGVVFRPAAAVPPVARVAQFSNIGGDPEFKGEMGGTFQETAGGIEFKTSGFVEGKFKGVRVFGHQTKFNGTADFTARAGNTTKYTSGTGDLTSQPVAPGNPNVLIVTFHVTVHGNELKISGKTGTGYGALAGAKKGTIEGKGSVDRNNGTITIELTVKVP